MQLLKKKGLLIFWLFLLLDCYFIYTKDESYRIFTKPLLVPILGFYIFLKCQKKPLPQYKNIIVLGFGLRLDRRYVINEYISNILFAGYAGICDNAHFFCNDFLSYS